MCVCVCVCYCYYIVVIPPTPENRAPYSREEVPVSAQQGRYFDKQYTDINKISKHVITTGTVKQYLNPLENNKT